MSKRFVMLPVIAVGNLIKQPGSIPHGIDFTKSIEGLRRLLIVTDDNIGLWDEVKIYQTFTNGG